MDISNLDKNLRHFNIISYFVLNFNIYLIVNTRIFVKYGYISGGQRCDSFTNEISLFPKLNQSYKCWQRKRSAIIVNVELVVW